MHVRKITQHEEKFFQQLSLLKFDLNMEYDEVYGKFVLTVCSILYFCKKLADSKKNRFCLVLIFAKTQNGKRTNCFHEYL